MATNKTLHLTLHPAKREGGFVSISLFGGEDSGTTCTSKPAPRGFNQVKRPLLFNILEE